MKIKMINGIILPINYYKTFNQKLFVFTFAIKYIYLNRN